MTSKSLSPAVTRPRVGSSLRATPVPREKIRDPIRTKNRILKIAAQEFAEKGFDGVRIDRIVSKCGISKSLLYHYFSSKEDLFTQVMELSYASMRSHQDGVDLVSRHPIEDMRALVLSMVEHYAQEPEFIRLLATENVHKAEHIKNSHAIQDMYNPLRLKIRRILKEGQKSGLFRKDVDWVDLYISICGMASYFVSNQHTLSVVLGVDLSSRQRLQKRMQHVPDMVLSYLCLKKVSVKRNGSTA